jgi:hypothetical protein
MLTIFFRNVAIMHSITVLGVKQTGSKYNGQCHHAPTGSFIAEILMEKILIYN